jgi:hypothetical protein
MTAPEKIACPSVRSGSRKSTVSILSNGAFDVIHPKPEVPMTCIKGKQYDKSSRKVTEWRSHLMQPQVLLRGLSVVVLSESVIEAV